MAVGDTLPHCTGTGTSADPYIFSTEEGFIEAIVVSGAYVEASENNLIFNANNGVFRRLNIYCRNLEGKGLTVLNLLSDFENANLINLCSSGANCTVVVNDVNFYNMCILSNNSNDRNKNTFLTTNVNSGTGNNTRFNRCNFTGILKGYLTGLFRSKSYNQFSYDTLLFSDCTFNINLDVPKNNSISEGSMCVFGDDNCANDNFTLSNCTVCISGITRQDSSGYSVSLLYNVKIQNVCIMNDPLNPLISSSNTNYGNYYLRLKSGSTYSYCKLYIQRPNYPSGTHLVVSGASMLLCNVSRTGSISGTCIQMQETDPTASDYIYDADNLANAGFLVGTVII